MTSIEWAEFKSKIKKLISLDIDAYKSGTKSRILDHMKDDLKIQDIDEYYNLIVNSPEEQYYLRTHCTMTGSQFFREDGWDYIDENVIPYLIKKHGEELNIWCASCSTGEEVYSLISILLKYIPEDKIHITATDIDREALDVAKKGAYGDKLLLQMPPEKYNRIIERRENNEYFIKKSLTEKINFKELDLLNDEYIREQHLIVCRNIIKWFDRNTTAPVVKQKLVDCLVPKGIIYVGSASVEYIEDSYGVTKLQSGIYLKGDF